MATLAVTSGLAWLGFYSGPVPLLPLPLSQTAPDSAHGRHVGPRGRVLNSRSRMCRAPWSTAIAGPFSTLLSLITHSHPDPKVAPGANTRQSQGPTHPEERHTRYTTHTCPYTVSRNICTVPTATPPLRAERREVRDTVPYQPVLATISHSGVRSGALKAPW